LVRANVAASLLALLHCAMRICSGLLPLLNPMRVAAKLSPQLTEFRLNDNSVAGKICWLGQR